ncbi:MAG: diguanylate cyclase [Pseudomonadota bacterium]|nr:diguanylate cyclase [Pseudomonadota bacterium]
MSEHSPPELARETLRTLAVRKLSPTPENYTAIFNELSGAPVVRDRALRALTAALASAGWLDDALRDDCVRQARAGDWERALRALIDAGRPGKDGGRARLLEQLAILIEHIQPALGDDDVQVLGDAARLAQECRALAAGEPLAGLNARLQEFNSRLAFVCEEQAEVRHSLLGMLRMVFQNIAACSLGDAWMEQQIALLVGACEPPLTLRRLDDLQRRIKDLAFKQGELKRATETAQDESRQLFSTFVVQLAGMAELSQARTESLAVTAAGLLDCEDLPQARSLLQGAQTDLHDMAARTGAMSEELQGMHARMAESEAELGRLRRELEALSLANRHDALTGALNRKGLDEALVREVARARRVDSPLSIALLDIDNFKVINDQHGHPTGDAALAHLADMARAVLRAHDTLCRYGGEEFVILLPDTTLDDGVNAIRKLQRALTRELFMADSRRIVITFSAGVAMLSPDEDPLAAIERADRGMYQAKRNGKNRVVVA